MSPRFGYLSKTTGLLALANIALTFLLYLDKPGWPNGVRRFVWEWWSAPIFLAFLVLVSILALQRCSRSSLVLSILAVPAYLFVELAVWIVALEQAHLRYPVAGLAYVGVAYVVINGSAIAMFSAFQVLIYVLDQRRQTVPG
jgi:hypothetical protein